MDVTNQQADRAIAAINAFALESVTETEMSEQRVAVSDSLSKHIARVERVLRCSYSSLGVHVQNLLEECRAVAGVLAPTVDFIEFDKLDATVWAVAKGAM